MGNVRALVRFRRGQDCAQSPGSGTGGMSRSCRKVKNGRGGKNCN